jgi:hypothetical protein
LSPVAILLGVAFPVLVGLATALAMGSGGATEFWIARIAASAGALDLVGLTIWWLYKSDFTWINSTIGAVLGICVVLLLPAVLKWVDAKELNTTAKPDVSLRFVFPEAPSLVLENNSDVVAKDGKWEVALFNMDLPDRNEPLPIPVSTFDWIRPHSVSGPQALFASTSVSSLLKPGDRLFGSAAVICPACSRGHTYLVYIEWGKGGWFSEIEDQKSGLLPIPRNLLKETRMEYFDRGLSGVPRSKRVPIGQP